ncbi:hypothetical protein [Sphingobacterium bovistauri]|uniref:Four helix bundle sensory module for signal transduction n=1 Tax=Sphingobacterium bovistauri TaxID=2781959 RepID=A0ABS7Z191_9SPHI|nr:hypothetical protein [Sphingobacterium bovistauri]MCA5003938.1 hypothetical protein [Sphingobacterium bovistauri]
MKNYLFAFFFLLQSSQLLYAQSPLDTTTTFEDQRQRVNNLLDARSKKFGDYDNSLTQKTGIFGLFKSKNDMQKSIDILKQIVITDNNIFLETRKLLELKDSETQRFEKLATEYDQQVTAYMKSISKLQAENEKLRKDIEKFENEDHDSSNQLYISTFVIIGLLIANLYQFKLSKSKNVTQV